MAIWLGGALVLGTWGCGGDKSQTPLNPDEVVATWSGGEIRRRDVSDLVTRHLARSPEATPDQRTALVEKALSQWVRMETLHREAIQQGLERRQDISLRIAAREAEVLSRDWIEAHRGEIRVDPARVDEEVKRRIALVGDEIRRFRNIFLRAPHGDKPARAKARATIDRIRKELEEGRSFEDLARTYSDSITARSGGRVEWTPRRALDPAIAESVFSLKEGETGFGVETRDGIHLFRLDQIRHPEPPATAALLKRVEGEMRDEALRSTDAALRTRAWDESGVSLDTAGLAAKAAWAPESVASWNDGRDVLSRSDLELLQTSPVNAASEAPEAFARKIIIDRILATRRMAEPPEDRLQEALAMARRSEVITAAREERMKQATIEVGPDDARTYYDRNISTATFLARRLVDLLFIEQTVKDTEGVSGVYAAGEAVSKELRDGKSFDEILDACRGRPGRLVRRLSRVDLDALRQENLRVGKELRRLDRGDVSAPIYVENGPIHFGESESVVAGTGLLFLRLLEIVPVPFEEARPRINEEVARIKRTEAIDVIKRKLDEEGKLHVLVRTF